MCGCCRCMGQYRRAPGFGGATGEGKRRSDVNRDSCFLQIIAYSCEDIADSCTSKAARGTLRRTSTSRSNRQDFPFVCGVISFAFHLISLLASPLPSMSITSLLGRNRDLQGPCEGTETCMAPAVDVGSPLGIRVALAAPFPAALVEQLL